MSDLEIRPAAPGGLPSIVAMLADDPLGAHRESPGVRIHADERGSGLSTQLIEWAVAESRRRRCQLLQLTSDASRTDAHRFYERLGFEASHLGFKMAL